MNIFNISPNVHPIDLGIIIAYLVLTVVVGIYYGRGVKTFRDFAVGNQRFGVSVLTMTIFATAVGGNITTGTISKIYSFGVPFILIMIVGPVFALFLYKYIVPRVVRFNKALSLGDLMNSRFGSHGRIISGLATTVLMVGGLGAQVAALGILSHYLIGVPFVLSVVISSLVVVLYSAYGGIKSVIMTDVMQFFLIVIALPLICIIGIHFSGGYEALLHKIPRQTFIPKTDGVMSIISLCIIFCIPLLVPERMQRMFLSKDSNLLVRAIQFSAVLLIPLYFIILLLALIAIGSEKSIAANAAFPYVLTLLPPFVKGLAIAGMMAVIMSTADSILNSGSVFIMNDLIKPFFQNLVHKKNELFWTRLLTLILGILPIFAAIKYENPFDAALFGRIFWMPIILVPLYAVLFDLPGNLRDFYRAGIAGISTFLIWSFLPLSFLGLDSNGAALTLEKLTYINSLLPSFLMNGLFFFKGKVYSVIHEAVLKERKIVKSSHNNFLSLFGPQRRTLKMWFIHTTHEAKAPYSYVGALGVAMFITPLFYFDLSQNDNLLITLKIIARLMIWCVMLRDDWFPQKGLPFCIYWHTSLFAAFTMVPCLAYVRCGLPAVLTGTQGSAGVETGNLLMLVLSGIVILSVVHRHLLSFHSLLAILFSACVSYTYANTPFTKPVLYVAYFFTILNIMCYMLSGRVFQLQQKQIKMYRHHVAKLAHETLNLLINQSSSVGEIKRCLEDLLKRNPDLSKDNKAQKIQEELTYISKSVSQTCRFIDIYQLTVREQQQSRYPHRIEINDFTKDLLQAFPFSETCTREMFHFYHPPKLAFATFINPTILCNVLHNLMRNGHYATLRNQEERTDPPRLDVSFARKGPEIEIKVKDNGCGMTPSQQHQVFNAFYTTKEEGMGVGLAFCKEAVEAAGGEIFCTSVYGQGTTFVILLPTKEREADTLDHKRQETEKTKELKKKQELRQEMEERALKFLAVDRSEEDVADMTHFTVDYIRKLKKKL